MERPLQSYENGSEKWKQKSMQVSSACVGVEFLHVVKTKTKKKRVDKGLQLVQMAGDEAFDIFLDCWLEEGVAFEAFGRGLWEGSWECGEEEKDRKRVREEES